MTERPDLTAVPEVVRAYIEGLEAELAQLRSGERKAAPAPEPSEPPTTMQVITVSRQGVAKRTPRHLYGRQRRGGMGVFDLETAEPDAPALLAHIDEGDNLLLVTNLGRAFRLPVEKLVVGEVRDKGAPLAELIRFHPNEHAVAVLPAAGGEYLVLASERGWTQRVRKSFLGKNLFPGMSFHDVKQGGNITAACWTAGQDHVLLATRQGVGIRFRETQIPERGGCLGLRVEPNDQVAAVAAVTDDSDVFVISADGKGTRREMSGFRMNKAPGAGGKQVLKTEQLVTAVTVQPGDDLFVVSETGKIIRFQADDVPPKSGVVQGVNCMALRNDGVTAAAVAALETA